MRSAAKRYDRPRRVCAILEPIEVKPRAVRVGQAHEYERLPIASRQPIYARPASRDVLVYRPTFGDQLRDAVAIGLQRTIDGLRDLDGILWDCEHPRAFLAFAACFAAVTIALTYFIVQLVLGLMNSRGGL